MYQAVLLPDGPSDMALARILEEVCLDLGAEVAVTPVDPRTFDSRSVGGRLGFLRRAEVNADLVFIHRDAEKVAPHERRKEVLQVSDAVASPIVPVVPVRMTEAWLLLDETAIRFVAGRPNGRVPLDLPRARDVESLADPKECLRRALEAASAAKGRDLDRVKAAFGSNRRLLLERLDRDGPIRRGIN